MQKELQYYKMASKASMAAMATMHSIPISYLTRHKTESANVANVFIKFLVKFQRHKISAIFSYPTTISRVFHDEFKLLTERITYF